MSEVKLWDHQVSTVEAAIKQDSFALFHDPGTGKTLTTITILRHHFNTAKRIKRTLILCPLIVTRNWVSELSRFTKIQKEKILLLEGTVAEKAASLEGFEGVVITNYDVFVKDIFTKAAMEWKPEILVCDESHKCKDVTSKRTKNLMKLSLSMGKTANRYILTGSPITNTQLDLWSQFFILDNGATFGESFWGFKSTYFYNANEHRKNTQKYFPNWMPRPGIDKYLSERLHKKSSVVKKEECLDLPPLINQEVIVQLSPEQKRAYDAMKKDFITFIQDKAAIATIALTKMLRMQQILSGFLPLEDGTIGHFPCPRVDALGEILESIPSASKVIIWAVFHEDYKTIRKKCMDMGLGVREVHGLVSEKDKHKNLEEFKTDPSVKVLIGSPQALGIGVNIIEAQYSIWYSRTYSLEQDEQATARNYRGGSEIHAKVVRYDLVAENTMDKLILDALRDKKNIAENVLRLDVSKI